MGAWLRTEAEIIPFAGHLPHRENPEATLSLVQAFLERIQETPRASAPSEEEPG